MAFQIRRATTSAWAAANPVLAAGEQVYDTTEKKVKIGDGTTAWNALPYQGGGAVAWGGITGTLSAQTDLGSALSGKAASSHGHAPSDVTGTAVVDNDARLTNARTPTTHAHAPGDVTGTAVVTADSRLTDARTPTTHAHAPGDVTGTAVVTADSRLTDARTPTAHSHAESDVTSLTSDLSGKASTSHTHSESQVTNLTSDLAGKAASSHAHAESDVTNLVDDLAAKTALATGVFADSQISVLQADGALSAALGVQTWCGTDKTAQDVFTLVANKTYRMKAMLIYNTGTVTHTTAFAFSFGGTVTRLEYLANLWSAAANTIATAQSTTHVTGIASKVLNATSTNVYTLIQLEGIFVVGGSGGACTPQINFSANPTGTNLLKAGSYFSFELIGADTFARNGGWA